MQVTGPFLDEAKRVSGRRVCWYLQYFAPKRNADGTLVLAEKGRPITQRYRPFYATKAEALADIPRLREQHEVAGSGQFIFNRRAADDYESALTLAGGVSVSHRGRARNTSSSCPPPSRCRFGPPKR